MPSWRCLQVSRTDHTEQQKDPLAIRDIETKKVSLMRNFFRSIEPDVIYSADRVQDLRSLLWQDSSGIYGKGGNTIVLGVQEGIGSGSIMASC